MLHIRVGRVAFNTGKEQSDYILMNMKHTLFQAQKAIFYLLVGWGCTNPLSSHAAKANVSVADDFFSPPSTTINVNDQVTWTWTGAIGHSTTSDTSLWDSTVLGNGATYSRTFTTAGTFPYHCTPHFSFMKATVTVLSGNTPPSVAISGPSSGATFAAPWTGKIQAAVSDSDGTVSKVDFFANTSYLGTVSNPPANVSFTVTNLPASDYTLKAVATDNGGATNTSAGVAIKVVTPTAISVSAPKRVSPTSFQFSYSAVPGLRYVVLRSGTVTNLLPISTNTAANASETFLDTNASGAANFYRVQVAPNL
jgi:plastocyanin